MKPVGTILQTARREIGLSLEQVSKKTKIRVKYLQLIDKNDWDALPGIAYARGFIKSYAEVVGLVPEKTLALFRREFIDAGKQEVLPQSFVDFPGKRKSVWLTIRAFLSKLFS